MRRPLVLLVPLLAACATTHPLPAAEPVPPPAALPPVPTVNPVPAAAHLEPAAIRLRLRAAGDTMMGSDFPEPDFPPEGAILAAVQDLLRDADLTFVNLEGPLCDGGSTNKCRPHQNCYAFHQPTRFGKHLVEAGIDVVSTANNHNGDFGEECRRQTETTLDSLGIRWSGSPGTIAELEVKGLKVALLGFHTSESTNDVNDIPAAEGLVKKARAGHDLVIVSFHGGAEGAKAQHVVKGREMFFGEDRGDLPAFTHAVIDAGADLVLGHGPHVVRAMEAYKGHLIVYSMGNFATYGRFHLEGPTAAGEIVEVTLDGKGGFHGGRILPTRLQGRGLPEPDPDGAAIGYVKSLTAQDFPDTGAIIGADGSIQLRPASTASR